MTNRYDKSLQLLYAMANYAQTSVVSLMATRSSDTLVFRTLQEDDSVLNLSADTESGVVVPSGELNRTSTTRAV